MTDDQLNQIASDTEAAEGRIPHLYWDNGERPALTTGIGHLVASVEASLALPWQVNGQPATEADVREDWAAMTSNIVARGMVATHYASLCRCRLSDASIDALLRSDMTAFIVQMRKDWPKFDQWPDGAQASMFDLAFNLGMRGLQSFTHLMADVAAENWLSAARDCHRRPPISDERNARTREGFLQAAQDAIFSTPPTSTST